MSLDFYFYVETHRSGEWNRPEALALEERAYQQLGEFTWIPGRSPIQHLFFGENALFRFRRERPPSTQYSALFQYLDRFYDYECDEHRLSWTPFEELLVDLWDETSLLISARVPAGQAALFGDGSQPFPEHALITAGWDTYAIQALREGMVITAPVDRTVGQGRYEIEICRPELLVLVTWQASVSDYVSNWRAEAFRSLRQYGNDVELRIVSLFS